MPRRRDLACIGLGIIAGALVAASVVLIAMRQNSTLAFQMSGIAKPSPQPSPDGLDPYQMKFADIDKDLSGKNGVVFEHYALFYLISIDQTTSGLLRRVKSDALHPELREYAAQMTAVRDDEVTQMFAWQKAWRYSHH